MSHNADHRRPRVPAPRRRGSRSHCPSTGKVRYRDSEDASDALTALRNAARRAEESGGEHRIQVVRKYRCEECNSWHLTSWPTAAGPGQLAA